jgi:UDP:flavonoid glycosyltransferase YjiC (YdhE family)
MSRFLFLTWDGAGNQPPAVAVAQALEIRGHQITFAGYKNQEHYFSERGFEFVLLQRSAAKWRDDDRERMFAVKRDAVWASSEHLDDVPQLLASQHFDALVVDCLMFGALAAAERIRLPTVALVHSAPGALMPPKGQFETFLLDAVNRVRLRAGLRGVKHLWDAWARFPAFSNSIRQLDPLGSRTPSSFRYFGPLADACPPSNWKSPWSPSDNRPLVLVSFSTGPYWDQTSRILRTLEALSGTNCRVLVTAGPVEIDPAGVPENAVVVGRAPHDEILPNAALTVTHAGHGTVMASLKYGVPLLCLPNSVADQPILARQVEKLGCGLSLDGEYAAPAEIKRTADRLLVGPSYAANALILTKAVSQSAGVSSAVTELERLASQGRDVFQC